MDLMKIVAARGLELVASHTAGSFFHHHRRGQIPGCYCAIFDNGPVLAAVGWQREFFSFLFLFCCQCVDG